MSVASPRAPRVLAASAMRRSAAGTRGSRADSALSWRAAPAARAVSPSARWARTRPARICGRSSGRGPAASASRKRRTASCGRAPLERDPARLHERVASEGVGRRHRGDEPVQELEPAVQVAEPGERHAAPERDLRQDRPRRAALDDLVPELHRLRGPVQQEARDAEQVAGDERHRLGRARRAAPGRGRPPPRRRRPRRSARSPSPSSACIPSGGGGPSGSAAR